MILDDWMVLNVFGWCWMLLDDVGWCWNDLATLPKQKHVHASMVWNASSNLICFAFHEGSSAGRSALWNELLLCCLLLPSEEEENEVSSFHNESENSQCNIGQSEDDVGVLCNIACEAPIKGLPIRQLLKASMRRVFLDDKCQPLLVALYAIKSPYLGLLLVLVVFVVADSSANGRYSTPFTQDHTQKFCISKVLGTTSIQTCVNV